MPRTSGQLAGHTDAPVPHARSYWLQDFFDFFQAKNIVKACALREWNSPSPSNGTNLPPVGVGNLLRAVGGIFLPGSSKVLSEKYASSLAENKCKAASLLMSKLYLLGYQLECWNKHLSAYLIIN